MSCLRPLPIKLSPRARADFIDILRFTGETWGRDQLFVYRDKINEALMALSQNPQLGHFAETTCPRHIWSTRSAPTSLFTDRAEKALLLCVFCTNA